MSKTERALESEALDREVLADGHTDGVERDDGDDGDEVAVFDAEAGERDWPIAPTDEVRRPTLDADEPAPDEVPADGPAAGDGEADLVQEPAGGTEPPSGLPADVSDDEFDGGARLDAEAEAEPVPVPEPADDGFVAAEHDVDVDDVAPEQASPADDPGPSPAPGQTLTVGVGQGWIAPSSPDGESPTSADESGSWDPPLDGAAHGAVTEPGTGSNGHRPREDDEGTRGFVGPEPSEDVLEELRRADVDGPTVIMAPQDDTTTARRRPRRLPEYDPAPIPVPTKIPRVLGRKPRVRKVTRVVRSVDPWSVFKIAMIASLVLYVIVLTSGVLLWNVAYATGTIDNVERFFESFGWSSFEFNGGEIFHAAWIGGLFAAVGLTGLAVLGAALFNLITDLVGGVRLTVLEEEVVETRISPMRRFVVRRSAPQVPAVETDESGPLIRETIVDDSGAIIRRTR